MNTSGVTGVKNEFILHPWPDKRNSANFISKMKHDTIERLDRIWSESEEKKVADHVKECRRCGRMFSPGTSHQQLLTHAKKCELRSNAFEHGGLAPTRGRVDPGTFGESHGLSTEPQHLPSHHHHPRPTPMPIPHINRPSIPEPIGQIDHRATEPLLVRLTDLSIKERDVYNTAMQEITAPDQGVHQRAIRYLETIQSAIQDVRRRHAEQQRVMGVSMQNSSLLDMGHVRLGSDSGQVFVVPPVIGVDPHLV